MYFCRIFKYSKHSYIDNFKFANMKLIFKKKSNEINIWTWILNV